MSTASWSLSPGAGLQVSTVSRCVVKHKSKIFCALVGKVTIWNIILSIL